MAKAPIDARSSDHRRFTALVREAREKKFKSARDFFQQNKFTFGYARYVQVEAGTMNLPSIEIALEIIRALGLPMRHGLLAWAYDQAPDPDSKSVFADEDKSSSTLHDDTYRDEDPKMTKVAAQFIEQEPLYWQILLTLSTETHAESLSVAEIAKAIGIEKKRTANLLEWLSDYGLVEKPTVDHFATRKRFSIPIESEFSKFRLTVAKSAHQKFDMQPDDVKYTASLTRRLTTSQIEETKRRSAQLMRWLDKIPTAPASSNTSLYCLSVFGSPTKLGNI